MLKHLSKIKIEFNPLDPRCTSAVEFLAQCTAKKTRESNPKCELLVKRRTDSTPPVVTVTFNNGVEEVMNGLSMAAQQMRKRILDQAEEMETAQMFKDAGVQWPVEIPDEEAKRADSRFFKLHKNSA